MDLEIAAILSIIITFWGLLYWWSSNKPYYSRTIVVGNVVIWLSYTIYLMSVLFNLDLSRGGGGFAAVMMTMIISPIHVAVTGIITYLSYRFLHPSTIAKAIALSLLPVILIFGSYLIGVSID